LPVSPTEDPDETISIPTIDTSKPSSTSELGEFFFQLGIFFQQLESDEDLFELWYHDLDEDELVWKGGDVTEVDEALGSADQKQPPNTEDICLEVGKVLWDEPMVDMCNQILQAENAHVEFGELCGQLPDVPIAAPRVAQDQTGPLTLERLKRLLKGLCTGDDLPKVVLTPDLSVDDGRHRVVANFLKYGKCKEINVWRRRPVKTAIDTSKKRSILTMGEVGKMLRIAKRGKDMPIMDLDAPAITGVLTQKGLHGRFPQAGCYTSSRQIKEGLSAGVDNVSQERQMRNRFRELDDLLHEDYITAAQCKQARKASISKLGSTSDTLAPEDILGGGKRNAQLFEFKQLRADDELANTDEIENTWNEEYCNRRIQAGRTVFEGNVDSSDENGIIVCGLSRGLNGVNIVVRHSDAHRTEVGDRVVVQLLPYDGWRRELLSAIIPNDRVVPDCWQCIVPDLSAARAALQKLASVQRLLELQDAMEGVKATLREGSAASEAEKAIWKDEAIHTRNEAKNQLEAAQAEAVAMAAFQPTGRVVRVSHKAHGNAPCQSLTQTRMNFNKLQNLIKYLRYDCHNDPSVTKRPPSTQEGQNMPWQPEEFKLEDVARRFDMDGVEMTADRLWCAIGSTEYIRGVAIAPGVQPEWIQVKKSKQRIKLSKKPSGGGGASGESGGGKPS
jgi:hypothetical protein